ncbi:MAG: hypothetical protein H5T62_09980 [Anaerolineae bacterium]|nr:hypothetical protein [Anaerolineae bacterium]
MSERVHDEKEEEKQHEKEAEKNWDEKWRRDPLSAIIWATILIWAGFALLLENLGFLVRFETVSAWDLIFVGVGLLLLGEALLRVLIPAYRRPVTGTVIFGIILLSIGLGSLVNWGVIWAVVLIILGVSLLLRGFITRG